MLSAPVILGAPLRMPGWAWLACLLLLVGSMAPQLAAAEEPAGVTGWIGRQGDATLAKVAAGALPLQPVDLRRTQALARGLELWLRVPVPAGPEPLVLEFPSPIIDSITVHQLVQGRWTSRSAGDHLPLSEWPVAGRYPVFPLEPGASPVLVQVRHALALRLPMHLVAEAEHHQHALLEYLGLGITLGALALLLAHCVWRAWMLRDGAYVLLGTTALLMMLAVAAITGVAAHLLWPAAGRWADIAQGALALLTAGMATVVAARLSAAEARMPRLGRLLGVLGVLGLPVAAAYVMLARADGLLLLGAYVFTTSVLSLLVAVLIALRGDAVGRWMLAGAVPLTAAVFASISRSLGWLEASWITDYGLVLAMLLDLPMLLAALNSRSRERRSTQLRQQAAGNHDPLTGLPRSSVFYARTIHALRRWSAHREPVAIGLVEIANLPAVKAARGSQGGEESILRAVILLRGVLRDVDTAGRLGEGRFGILLEGAATRQQATDCATRLIAAGLRENEHGEPALRFHVVFVLPQEYNPGPDQLLRELASLLAGLSAGTRRPLRFLSADSSPLAGRPSDGLEPEPAPGA